jgi:molecular chaperone Hsp31 and glyoxalase 3
MLKSLLGLAPQKEQDGSFKPSKLALKLATSKVTDYAPETYDDLPSPRQKVLVVFTEQKNMTMQNGLDFSTGNHPVEALVPMLHLQNAGFDFDIATPTGRRVVFEMWAMPNEDVAVMRLYDELLSRFEEPKSVKDIVGNLNADGSSYAAVFIPGGHGAMLGIPEDKNVGRLLRYTHEHGVYTISLCHGPGALLATTLEGQAFPYRGYEMAVFPDSVDKQTPKIGYLPGHMPWQLAAKLDSLGAKVVNHKADDTCCIDRELITGASPAAADNLGKLAANALLERLKAQPTVAAERRG